jgi:hypothetical protein
MDSSLSSGLTKTQKAIYEKFKSIGKIKCTKCSGSETVPVAYGDPESDYKAVESKTGVLKYGGKTKANKNIYCKKCSSFV